MIERLAFDVVGVFICGIIVGFCMGIICGVKWLEK